MAHVDVSARVTIDRSANSLRMHPPKQEGKIQRRMHERELNAADANTANMH